MTCVTKERVTAAHFYMLSEGMEEEESSKDQQELQVIKRLLECSPPLEKKMRYTDSLWVPAAMGMESAEFQGRSEYSAPWGAPLSVHHVLQLAHALQLTSKTSWVE